MGYPGFQLLCGSATAAILTNFLAPQYLFRQHAIFLTIEFFALSSLAYFVYSVIIYPHFLSPIRHLPQPSGSSFIHGQFKAIHNEPSGEPGKRWMETVPNDGFIYYRTLFNGERVMMTSLKSFQEVLSTKSYDFIKPPSFVNGIGRILGVGVLLAEGDEHKRQRRLLNPAFSFRHIKDLYPIFWAKGQEMVLSLERHISTATSDEKPSNVVDVKTWINRTTLDIIGDAGMGRDFGALSDPSNELYQQYQKIFSPGATAKILAMLNLIMPPWIVRNLPVKRNDDIEQASQVVKRVAYNLIQDKKAKIENGESRDVDILSVALKSGGFSDDDLVNQLMTFLAAGHETTASAFTWAILLLCQHPDVHKRLREALLEGGLPSTHDENASVTSADIENIPYLSAVCNEVLRVRPPVGLTLRQTARDTTVQGQFIPKDTTVALSLVGINQSKEFWGEDAAEFKPERWMEPGCHNSGGADSNYAFATFLHGPRSCIGNSFAKAEFMCLLAAWVSTFETELEDPDRKIEIQSGVTQRPKGGLPVKIRLVEG